MFESDTAALGDLYTLVVANGALVQLAGLVEAEKYLGETLRMNAGDIGFPAWDRPSLWGESEFECAVTVMRRCGIVCNDGDSGLTAEFPWDEGASSAVFGDQTSLMRFQSGVAHPVAGNGLFYRLDLPLSLEREQLAECANYLNVYETTGVNIPPFFGAWCGELGNRTLSYIGFWPNCMYKKGTVANIAIWCRVRSQVARQAIGNMGRGC